SWDSSSAFLARRASSTTSSTVPVVPCAVPRRARMFTLALPIVRASSATVPGRVSIEIVHCLVLAMLAPPNGLLGGNYTPVFGSAYQASSGSKPATSERGMLTLKVLARVYYHPPSPLVGESWG